MYENWEWSVDDDELVASAHDWFNDGHPKIICSIEDDQCKATTQSITKTLMMNEDELVSMIDDELIANDEDM